MDIAIADSALRQALDGISDWPFQDPRAIESIAHPHQIERVDPQPPPFAMCLDTALGVAQRPAYAALVETKQVGVGAHFVDWLSEHGHLHQQRLIIGGCLVLYFSGPVWTHAGIGQDDGTVISKWGDYLQLRHYVDEVPSVFGDIARVYQHPGSDGAME